MNKYGISGILPKTNSEFFNIMIWNMKLACENIMNNGSYQPESKENAVKLKSAIDDYISEANKVGL